jgi:hypothetical protein
VLTRIRGVRTIYGDGVQRIISIVVGLGFIIFGLATLMSSRSG